MRKPGASPVRELIDGNNPKLLLSEFKKKYGYKDDLKEVRYKSVEKLPSITKKRFQRRRNGNSTQMLSCRNMLIENDFERP